MAKMFSVKLTKHKEDNYKKAFKILDQMKTSLKVQSSEIENVDHRSKEDEDDEYKQLKYNKEEEEKFMSNGNIIDQGIRYATDQNISAKEVKNQ